MKQLLPFLIIILFTNCQSSQNTSSHPNAKPDRLEYKRWVGDISHDPVKDSETFALCNGELYTYQYFNDSNGMEYEGEKIAIINTFDFEYNLSIKNETGRVRIRFIVNCKGEAGRYRVLGMDENYKEKIFDSQITDELLRITKSLKGWKTKQISGKEIDYYQYLVFKLKDGQIEEILP